MLDAKVANESDSGFMSVETTCRTVCCMKVRQNDTDYDTAPESAGTLCVPSPTVCRLTARQYDKRRSVRQGGRCGTEGLRTARRTVRSRSVRHEVRYGAVSPARSTVRSMCTARNTVRGGQYGTEHSRGASVRHGLRYGASVRYGIRYGAVSPARSTMAGGGRFAQSLLLVCNVFLVFVT